MPLRPITPSGCKAATGRLFDVNLRGAGLAWELGAQSRAPEGRLRRPRGLALQKTGTGAARVRLTVGEPIGGGELTRDFHVTAGGVWLPVGGWPFVKVEILALATGVEVSYSWTVELPPTPPRLFLVQSITAGTREVPQGAADVVANGADASWAWVTDDGGGALTVAQALAAGAAPIAVSGDRYTATGPNVLVWGLAPP